MRLHGALGAAPSPRRSRQVADRRHTGAPLRRVETVRVHGHGPRAHRRPAPAPPASRREHQGGGQPPVRDDDVVPRLRNGSTPHAAPTLSDCRAMQRRPNAAAPAATRPALAPQRRPDCPPTPSTWRRAEETPRRRTRRTHTSPRGRTSSQPSHTAAHPKEDTCPRHFSANFVASHAPTTEVRSALGDVYGGCQYPRVVARGIGRVAASLIALIASRLSPFGRSERRPRQPPRTHALSSRTIAITGTAADHRP
jgi:hypothetical protein